MVRKKINLLEKIGLGAGIIGIVSSLHYLENGEKALENPYILGLLAVGIAGVCSALYRNNRGQDYN